MIDSHSLVKSSTEDFAAFLDEELDSDKNHVMLKSRKVEEKEFENKEELQPLMTDECTHPGTIEQMPYHSGKILQAESGVAISYIHEGIRLQNHEIFRHRNADMKNPLRHKKLYLVLDLDHTLLNSTGLRAMTSKEEHLKSQTDSLQDVSKGSLFMVNSVHMMTKLRPFVHTFLKEVSEMFELYVDTMGDRAYALEMIELLDPQREYFSGRVISRDDRTQKNKKDLDIFLGHESAVLILDDTEAVWQKNKENLIVMERYFFFASSCCQFRFNCKSLAELKRDESETDGALATVLKVLKRIHNMFFDELKDNLVDRDVRQMLKTVKKEVLKGCKIVFSRAFPTIDRAENQHLWKMAEQLGATCVTKLDSSVTHVVSTDVGTNKAQWAVKHKKFLVLPWWILAANYRWQKQPEQNFSVNKVS
ncbi:hypothetical protein RGQ29_018290 [Quercus rubra]|uniref:RNA polymerase II C-terminal domain phosphatase-like n=1 Tax=Quercus rubra TaxID=3512 RepID=A0AAN7IYW4_QUERU|nr:hypothetical protein RGQ29_018290 [Quercus rubra]